MRELIVSAKKEDSKFIDYIYNKMKSPIRFAGGVSFIANIEDKVSLAIGVNDESFIQINNVLKSLVADVLAVGYKNKYLRENIVIDSSVLAGKLLLDTMCIFDCNSDARAIKRQIGNIFNINLDGCYNFRLLSIKEKWNEIILLANNYSPYFKDVGIIKDFLGYLIDAIPVSHDTITVIISDEFNEFELLNKDGLILDKFESFSMDSDIEENILFNLICYNPRMVKFFDGNFPFGNEFSNMLSKFFKVEKISSENN